MKLTAARTLKGIKAWLAKRNEPARMALVDWTRAEFVDVDAATGEIVAWGWYAQPLQAVA